MCGHCNNISVALLCLRSGSWNIPAAFRTSHAYGSPESVTRTASTHPPPTPFWPPTCHQRHHIWGPGRRWHFNGFCVQKMEGFTGAERACCCRVHDFLGQVQHTQRPSSRSGGSGWWEKGPGQRDGAGNQHQPWGAAEEAQLSGGRGVQAAER